MGYRVLKHQRTEAQVGTTHNVQISAIKLGLPSQITYAELIELSREKDGQLTCSDENYFDNCIVKVTLSFWRGLGFAH